jgi:hypothetical protein
MKTAPIEIKKENNRVFNLIWIFILIGLVVCCFLTMIPSLYFGLVLIATIVSVFEILVIIIPRRNNFISTFFLLLGSLFSNVALTRFYDLTWLLSPSLDNVITDPTKIVRLFSACNWGISFLTVVVALYMLLSSFSRVFFKKSKYLICSLISLVIVSISSVICFYIFPQTFLISGIKMERQIVNTTSLKLIDTPNILNAKEISSAKSSELFFIYVSGLSKGKRYGLRILNGVGEIVDIESKFEYCWSNDCSFYFEPLNTVFKRWEPDLYTVQVVSQKGETLTVISEKEIIIEELVIAPYDKGKEYPCRMWLTLDDSDKELLLITVDSQVMTNITVMAQCSGEGTYNAQLAVGNIGKGTDYSDVTIYPGEPMSIRGLGGNVANGYVRLIIDNQIVGEAIIDRGLGY